MNINQFISELRDELEFDEELKEDTLFKELEEWDSMEAMILIGFVSENFNVTLSADDIMSFSSISSVIDKIGREKFN